MEDHLGSSFSSLGKRLVGPTRMITVEIVEVVQSCPYFEGQEVFLTDWMWDVRERMALEFGLEQSCHPL